MEVKLSASRDGCPFTPFLVLLEKIYLVCVDQYYLSASESLKGPDYVASNEEDSKRETIAVLWDTPSCSHYANRRFGRAYHLHLQGCCGGGGGLRAPRVSDARVISSLYPYTK
jgi:hypothetical protein